MENFEQTIISGVESVYFVLIYKIKVLNILVFTYIVKRLLMIFKNDGKLWFRYLRSKMEKRVVVLMAKYDTPASKKELILGRLEESKEYLRASHGEEDVNSVYVCDTLFALLFSYCCIAKHHKMSPFRLFVREIFRKKA